MVDNAGIGKEIILLQQSALFVILDYFQLSSYRLWVCWRLTTWLAAPSSTLKPGALKAEKRKPSESAGYIAAPHSRRANVHDYCIMGRAQSCAAFPT